eukprot:750539-Hanusia_phi.AAC.3
MACWRRALWSEQSSRRSTRNSRTSAPRSMSGMYEVASFMSAKVNEMVTESSTTGASCERRKRSTRENSSPCAASPSAAAARIRNSCVLHCLYSGSLLAQATAGGSGSFGREGSDARSSSISR